MNLPTTDLREAILFEVEVQSQRQLQIFRCGRLKRGSVMSPAELRMLKKGNKFRGGMDRVVASNKELDWSLFHSKSKLSLIK